MAKIFIIHFTPFCFDLAIEMSLLPPPSEEYATREGLLQPVQAWAAAQGHAVIIAQLDKHRIILEYDRGGSYCNRKILAINIDEEPPDLD